MIGNASDEDQDDDVSAQPEIEAGLALVEGELPIPHLSKIHAIKKNNDVDAQDQALMEPVEARYFEWIKAMQAVEGSSRQVVVEKLVEALNSYRFFLDLEVIFPSSHYLYRQKGQHKLDNSVIEEFLPHLITKAVPELGKGVIVGPQKTFSAVYFASSLGIAGNGGGMSLRTKNQDFAVSRRLHLKASHNADFSDAVTRDAVLAYVASECKTNLDKTMFQEAVATAHDVKTAVPGAKYFLLAEWLDMPPISTAPTDIDEVLLLRKAKRMNSNLRKQFNSAEKRKKNGAAYEDFLRANPFQVDVFVRFADHVAAVLEERNPAEKTVLDAGYF